MSKLLPYLAFRGRRALVWVMLVLAATTGLAQIPRMVIEGSLQLDGGPVPNGTVVRILKADGSIVRSVSHYPSNPSQFGVRLGLQESLADGEPLRFRVVLSRRDSFEARIVGGPLIYRGATPQEAGVVRVLLYRNHAPLVRRSFPDTSIFERQSLRWRVLATDDDGDTLRYRLVDAPPGTMIEPLTGYVTYLPGYDDAGSYAVEVAVTDGREEVVMKRGRVRVVHVNRSPRITKSAPDLQTSEGQMLVVALPAEDPDRDSLSFSLIESSYRFRLFSRTGAFEWTPGYQAAGRYSCMVVVSDGTVADTSNQFTIVVDETNRAPVFGRALSDTVVFEMEPLAADRGAEDPDGDSLAYRLELAPEGVTLDQRGRLQWTPSYEQSGSYVIIVSASDGQRSAESVSRVAVLDLNRPPSYPTVAQHRDTARLPFGRLIDLSWRGAHDPDGDDALRYTLRLWGGGLDTSIVGITDTSIALFGRGRMSPDHVYYWTTGVTDGLAELWSPDTSSFRLIYAPVSAVPAREPAAVAPRMFSLEQPTSSANGGLTVIRYALTHRSNVDIAIYTMLGDRVDTIVSGERAPGQYETSYDAATLASGVYLFRLEAHPIDNTHVRDFVSTKKMVLVR